MEGEQEDENWCRKRSPNTQSLGKNNPIYTSCSHWKHLDEPPSKQYRYESEDLFLQYSGYTEELPDLQNYMIEPFTENRMHINVVDSTGQLVQLAIKPTPETTHQVWGGAIPGGWSRS